MLLANKTICRKLQEVKNLREAKASVNAAAERVIFKKLTTDKCWRLMGCSS